MTSSNGSIFRATGHLCGEFTGHRWIPRTKASDAELWCFSLICAWINGWVNNRDAGELRRHRAHYDVIVILYRWIILNLQSNCVSMMISLFWKRMVDRFKLYGTNHINVIVRFINMIRQRKSICIIKWQKILFALWNDRKFKQFQSSLIISCRIKSNCIFCAQHGEF